VDFFPYEPFDSNGAQTYVWDSLKAAFRGAGGVAYYRYHIFPSGRRRHREPDVLLLHPELGVCVIECKGCRIDNIAAIQGAEWRMRHWYEESQAPLEQAADQMFAVKNRFDEHRPTRGALSFHFAVALPFVRRAEWRARGFDRLAGDAVLVREDLYPGTIRASLQWLAAQHPQRPLTPEQWRWAVAVLRGQLPRTTRRDVPTGAPADSPARVLRGVESIFNVLDALQTRAAYEVPDGPQRVRGLAGTGKTVMLCQRAAKIHARHPDWRVGVDFFTKALYGQVLGYVGGFHRDMTGGEAPDWVRLQVLHAWGSRQTPGFYSTLARAAGVRPLGASEAGRLAGSTSPGAGFEYVCGELERHGRVPELFDALLIDEGQDLPLSFYRLALRALRDPKRLYWAYDEAQGVGSLLVPNAAAVFGVESGRPRVDLSGRYEGGIAKSHVFRRCYRSPRRLLMVAHALNMGLLRAGGPVQGITTQADWEDLGYTVEGNFRQAGAPVVLHRRPAAQCHPIDRDPELSTLAGSPLTVKTFRTEGEEIAWVAGQVAGDLRRGLRPEDLLVTALGGDSEKAYLARLRMALEWHKVPVWEPGSDPNCVEFRRGGHVTLANLFRAKGNEAYQVYATRFHYATRPLAWKGETELHKRNEAFVALTRARVWCVATGLEGPIFEEMRRAVEQQPVLKFAAFNRRQLQRVLDERESDDDCLFNGAPGQTEGQQSDAQHRV
jgi:superfamily I DNA and RNA helicase